MTWSYLQYNFDSFFCDVTSEDGRFAMSILKLNWFPCAVLIYVLVLVNSQNVHKRFEYKYSFKPPYLAQKDGSVPFWEYGGSKYSIFFTNKTTIPVFFFIIWFQ